MQKRIFILWSIWTLFGAGLIFGVAVSDSKNTPMAIAAMVLSVSPLLGMVLTLGSPKAFAEFNHWLRLPVWVMPWHTNGAATIYLQPSYPHAC